MRFNDFLADFLDKKDMSTTELGFILETSNVTIYNWMMGKKPNRKSRKKLKAVLQVDILKDFEWPKRIPSSVLPSQESPSPAPEPVLATPRGRRTMRTSPC